MLIVKLISNRMATLEDIKEINKQFKRREFKFYLTELMILIN